MGAHVRRPQVISSVAHDMARGGIPLRKGTTSDPIRCAILLSGSGSGMHAMVVHQQTKPHCGHITAVVISDQPEATGLIKAERLGIPTHSLPLPEESDRELRRHKHETLVQQLLEQYDIELILLSGYMRLVSARFVERWAPRILNIHPSLLPSFPGAYAHRDVLAAGVEVSGCTVHYVDAGMDSGEILGQRRVPVFADDDETTLAERVKVEEHQLYPKIIDELVTAPQNQV